MTPCLRPHSLPSAKRTRPLLLQAAQGTGYDEARARVAQQRLEALEDGAAATWRMVVPATNAASPTGVTALAQGQIPTVLRYSSPEVRQEVLAALDALKDADFSKGVRRSVKLALQDFQVRVAPNWA